MTDNPLFDALVARGILKPNGDGSYHEVRGWAASVPPDQVDFWVELLETETSDSPDGLTSF